MFPGIAQCGDCDYQITYEQHTKKSGLVFKYYGRSDKKSNYRCSQRKYLSETKIAEQIKKLVSIVALDNERCEMLTGIAHKMNKDEQRFSSNQTEKLNQELLAIKDRLNRLLDLHLDGDIDIEDYKEKKNTLIEQKANLDTQITKISEEGNLWLEPTLSFIKSCNQANKFIEDNNFTEMNKFIQKAGSNRKITNQELAIRFLVPSIN